MAKRQQRSRLAWPVAPQKAGLAQDRHSGTTDRNLNSDKQEQDMRILSTEGSLRAGLPQVDTGEINSNHRLASFYRGWTVIAPFAGTPRVIMEGRLYKPATVSSARSCVVQLFVRGPDIPGSDVVHTYCRGSARVSGDMYNANELRAVEKALAVAGVKRPRETMTYTELVTSIARAMGHDTIWFVDMQE